MADIKRLKQLLAENETSATEFVESIRKLFDVYDKKIEALKGQFLEEVDKQTESIKLVDAFHDLLQKISKRRMDGEMPTFPFKDQQEIVVAIISKSMPNEMRAEFEGYNLD